MPRIKKKRKKEKKVSRPDLWRFNLKSRFRQKKQKYDARKSLMERRFSRLKSNKNNLNYENIKSYIGDSQISPFRLNSLKMTNFDKNNIFGKMVVAGFSVIFGMKLVKNLKTPQKYKY